MCNTNKVALLTVAHLFTGIICAALTFQCSLTQAMMWMCSFLKAKWRGETTGRRSLPFVLRNKGSVLLSNSH